MLLVILYLMYGYYGYSNNGVHGIVLIPGGAFSPGTMNSVSVPGMSSYMPTEKQLRTKRLLRLLGPAYDEEWMSVDEPEPPNTVPDSRGISDILQERSVHEAVRDEVARLAPNLLDNNGTVTGIAMFLTRLSACRAVLEWEDQGALVWPRWVKVGTCVSSGYCSWPPGMTCASQGPKILHVLRWRCKRKKASAKKKKKDNCTGGNDGVEQVKRGKINCKWKKVPFPVTSACACTCLS